MDSDQPRIKHVFVVEMWREDSPNAPASWRGMVKHVAHGAQRYFVDFGDLTHFLTLRLHTEHAPDKDLS